MKYNVIVLASGSGERFGLMKQFVPIDGKPIFIRTLQKFTTDENCQITLVIPAQFEDVVYNCLNYYKVFATVVIGGNTRQESVRNAINSINSREGSSSIVLITDANRPLITRKTIDACLLALDEKNTLAVLTACKSINTSCLINKNGTLNSICDRTNMYELLMPQGFDIGLLNESHAKTKLRNATDDMQVILSVFPKVQATIVEASFWEGLKLTYPEDYKVFEVLI